MTDVRLNFENLRFDLSYKFGNIVSDDGLETAVCISLFTDRRVAEEELPRGENDRRGWFGDAIADIKGDEIGSRLWLLDRLSASPLTRTKAEEYAKEALQWLLDDAVAESVDVEAVLINREYIELRITIQRLNVRNKDYYRYQLVWEGEVMNARRI